jgi:hypothetical protein
MERQMRFITPGVAVISIASPLVGLAAESGGRPKGEMCDYFSNELTKCLAVELNRGTKVRIGSGGSARLKCKVTQWGYWGRPGRLDGKLIPVSVIHFELVDAGGKTLAKYRTPGKGQGFGVAYDGAPVRPADELKGNDAYLKDGLGWLARRTARDLTQGL